LRGKDSTKDQAYFVHTLSQAQLAHVLFPVGSLTKLEVRAAARRFGLPVAEQPESQDLCFVADGDYRAFLARHAPHLMQPGSIRDLYGRVLGQHQGLPAYTIGQRKGLGLAAEEPLYVLAILPEENALVVGPAKELGRDQCEVSEIHYVSGGPKSSFRAQAQIRYRAQPVDVEVTPLPNARARVHFASPQRDITPGQYLVLYDGEIVLGGGVICMASQTVL
jgi:tRNA-specific 2-thiouridylase